MDASAAVDAVRGCARAPALGSSAALDWTRIVLRCATARAQGVVWRARDPVQWTPRAWNVAADWLAHEARQRPIAFAVPVRVLRSWVVAARDGVRVRLFSDGGLQDGKATWAAAVFVQVAGLWRLAAAAAGSLEPAATVPAAELHGAARAWRLEAEVRARLRDSRVGDPPSSGLSPCDIFALEAWTSLQWAEPGTDEVASQPLTVPR